MQRHVLDLEHYPRKAHFDYFRTMAFPYVGLTAPVDITGLLAAVQRRQHPLFLTLCYGVTRGANQIPELRQRIAGDRIVQYDWCRSSHTEALPDGTYCYCTLDSRPDYPDFLTAARAAQARARANPTLEDGAESEELFFVSCLPRVSYTGLVQPVPSPADSNPRITWGKYQRRKGKIELPLSILCHHALVDGRQLAQFYDAVQAELNRLEEELR